MDTGLEGLALHARYFYGGGSTAAVGRPCGATCNKVKSPSTRVYNLRLLHIQGILPSIPFPMAEIELKTAPADFRFPTTNQTRHCFTRYIEFHRCVVAKGEESGDCGKFAKYYRSLCPGEWVEKWNEQRESGTFPGPL
ncbi:cytochrome c oxidase subunit 6b-2 [Olea europaea subsp. europaea]|uniref:Cytochrome c oxidase subunit 6b-2 n=1 Tax=Olea europaea subsp. europaea TaxID=158383 RepID=A0A8S0PE95_OLEEU|nr:cytochrome c oxidase subunit 6b-2 [Olea europaea subsp. europaea]